MFDPANPTRMGLERMESYCAANPDSPSALRRPSLSVRNGLWTALLVGEGIVGIGYSVDAALYAFDRQYMVGCTRLTDVFYRDFLKFLEDERTAVADYEIPWLMRAPSVRRFRAHARAWKNSQGSCQANFFGQNRTVELRLFA